ncbi:hypothetical protein [Roseibium sediminicola]|uniref:Uncharacterized protein n=1 Tax=Roseibium sediminicola TaxID=2933272 RepID=A0ABT0GPC2_9HYPH|nr:hypothetical protein [Roseibium sp. CAU 1639]MCK7610708.1 hypothetical protein [Roseibium sp. CAU 1639]
MQPTGSTDLEACPVSDDLLKRLLDTTLSAVADLGGQLPEPQRAALAVYCYRRAHFRKLGLTLAALCSRQSLAIEAGHAGELIFRQATAGSAHELDKDIRHRSTKAPVSLHVV